ncbi:hypothetical protein LCM4573_06305 [Rhizobium sp. LCM 4573]|nr:hypothetical protein LCM4573_06305 [Rhizobium sp. LCM 4573]
MVVALSVEVRIAILVELGSSVDIVVATGVGIIHRATNSVTAVKAVIINEIAGGMVVLVFAVFGNSLNDRSKHCARDDATDIVTTMIVHARTRIEAITAAIVIAANVSKHARASLSDPDILAIWIVSPGAVQNAGSA